MLEILRTVTSTIHADTDNPFLQGPFAPNFTEYAADTDSLTVIGEIPRDLDGLFGRNTHNPIHHAIGVYHPFDGDGMLHAVRFHDGRASYRNRFIETTGFLAEQAAGKALWPGLLQPELGARRGWGSIGAMKDNAGTDVLCHAGKLIATMAQGSEPWRIDPLSLDTLGPDPEWARKVPHGLSAHYKVDPATGDMMFFNYQEEWPHMHYGVIDRNNRLVHYTPIELPGARWPHDLGITRHYSILHDTSMFFDPELLKKVVRRANFFREVPTRFGVVPRFGGSADVKWFECTPCHIMHLTNCYEDGDEVIMGRCIMPEPAVHPVGAAGGSDEAAKRKAIYARILAKLDKHQNRTLMHR